MNKLLKPVTFLLSALICASSYAYTPSLPYSQIARQIATNLPSVMTAVTVGDSIFLGNHSVTNGVPSYGPSSLIENAIFTSGRYILLANNAVSGQTCASMLANLSTTVLAYHPQVAIFMIGTNDLVVSPTNSSFSTLLNCQEKVVITLLDNGILPVMLTTPPNNLSFLMAKRLQWHEYRLANYYGFPLIDDYKVFADPNNAGEYLSGLSSDGTHPNKAGVAAAQSVLIAGLQNVNAPSVYLYSGTVAEQSTGDPSNLLENGTFSYGPMNTWGLNTTDYTYTNPAAVYPYTGVQAQAVNKATGGAYILYGAAAAITGGDTMYFFGRVRVSGLASNGSGNGYNLQIAANVSSNSNNTGIYNSDTPWSFEWVAPANETGYYVTVYDEGGDASAQYNFNNFTLVDVTAQNAIWQPGQQGIQ